MALMPRPVHGWGNTMLAVAMTALTGLLAVSGLLFQAISGLVVLTLIVGAASRAWGAYKKDLELGLLRRPLAPELRWYRAQLAVRLAFLIAWVLVGRSTVALLPLFEAGADRTAWMIMGVVFALSVAAWLVPRKTVRAGTNAAFALGTLALAVPLVQTLLPPSREAVELDPPLRVEMAVFQGGESPIWNHHYIIGGQRHALDVVAVEDGRMIAREGSGLEDHRCFGKPLHAPASGTVVKVVSDRPDNLPGKTDLEQIVGNQVVIDIGGGRYVLMAHMKQGSAAVSVGDQVKCGQEVGQCGNSGNTSAPHLHMQVQSGPELGAPGLVTFPIAFRGVVRTRGGEVTEGVAGGLRRGDRLVPAAGACR
jgi:hypothetical protein